MKKTITLVFFFAAILSMLSAQVQLGETIFGENSSDLFGAEIQLSPNGNRMAIASPRSNTFLAGSIQIYEWTDNLWMPIGNKLEAGFSSDGFGKSVAFSEDGNHLIVGAPYNSQNEDYAGEIRVYEWLDDTWIQRGNAISGTNELDLLGFSVAISHDGNRIAAGASSFEGSSVSAGYVQIYDWVDENWVQQGMTIEGNNIGDHAGRAIALSANGHRLAIGSPLYKNLGDTIAGRGQVEVYEFINSDWVQLGNDIKGEAPDDNFGNAIAMSADGNRIIIGASSNSETALYAGHVQIYELQNETWQQLGNDIDGLGELNIFGSSVAISDDGNRIAASAPLNSNVADLAGHVRIFDWVNEMWQLNYSLTGEDDNDVFGAAISLSANGNRIAISAQLESLTGYAKVFEFMPISSAASVEQHDLKIYPNPTPNKLRFLGENSPEKIKITTLAGQIVYEKNILTTQIDISNLQNGIYFIHLKINNKWHTQKLIKTK